MKKYLMMAAVAMMATVMFTSCSKEDDDENQLNKWPAGQWIYEGQWLDYKNIDAVALSVSTYSDGSEKGIDIYVRSVADGLWYLYPSTDTYLIDGTTGTVRFGGKKFTYKLTDTTLTLTIDGKQYPFRRTNGIKPDVNDFPPALPGK